MTMRLRPDELVWQRLDDTIVVLDLRASRYFSVNGSGAVLWCRLAEHAEREELVSALVGAYGIDPERAGTDVDAFVDDLGRRGLLAP